MPGALDSGLLRPGQCTERRFQQTVSLKLSATIRTVKLENNCFDLMIRIWYCWIKTHFNIKYVFISLWTGVCKLKILWKRILRITLFYIHQLKSFPVWGSVNWHKGNKHKLSDENLWFRVSVLKALSINIQILKRTISSKFVVVSS